MLEIYSALTSSNNHLPITVNGLMVIYGCMKLVFSLDVVPRCAGLETTDINPIQIYTFHKLWHVPKHLLAFFNSQFFDILIVILWLKSVLFFSMLEMKSRGYFVNKMRPKGIVGPNGDRFLSLGELSPQGFK